MVALRTWAVSLVPESVYPQALSVDVVWGACHLSAAHRVYGRGGSNKPWLRLCSPHSLRWTGMDSEADDSRSRAIS